MNASSLSELLALGGHGPYVWGSFALCVAVAVGEVLALRARRRGLARQEPATDAPARVPTLTRTEGGA
jgi:heme exporter protein D